MFLSSCVRVDPFQFVDERAGRGTEGRGGWRPIPASRRSEEAVSTFIDLADDEAVEVDRADPLVGGFNADRFSLEWLGHEDPMVPPLNVAGGAYLARLEVGGVLGFRAAPGKRARGTLEDVRRPLHVDPLVGTLDVEASLELVELLLLGRLRSGRRTSGLCLQVAMHPFMPAIVLRMGGPAEDRQH